MPLCNTSYGFERKEAHKTSQMWLWHASGVMGDVLLELASVAFADIHVV